MTKEKRGTAMGGMSGGRVTLKDVADKTGYSINTVSRTLRGLYVAEPTAGKIKAAAAELGYIGNSVASSMRSGATRIVTVILGDLANPHYSRIAKIIVNYLDRHGYTATIYNTEDNILHEKNAIISSIRQGADGVLICPNEFEGANVDLLKAAGLPFVVFGRDVADPGITSVKLDDVKGGAIAAKHLAKLGCRRILFVNGPKGVATSMERLEGYRQALAGLGIPYDKAYVLFAPGLFNAVSADEKRWAALARRICRMDFDGIIAFSDQMALKVLQVLRNEGFSRIPIDRIPIVGFDNIMESFPLPLPLSSVGHAGEDMATAAPALLMEMLRGGDFIPRRLVLDVKVYARG
jgi:LacI family transcriptional regulator